MNKVKKKKDDDDDDGVRGKEDTPLIWSNLKAPIIKQIACGKDRTILLLATGELYSWYVPKDTGTHFISIYSYTIHTLTQPSLVIYLP
jgi:hypothetical protein